MILKKNRFEFVLLILIFLVSCRTPERITEPDFEMEELEEVLSVIEETMEPVLPEPVEPQASAILPPEAEPVVQESEPEGELVALEPESESESEPEPEPVVQAPDSEPETIALAEQPQVPLQASEAPVTAPAPTLPPVLAPEPQEPEEQAPQAPIEQQTPEPPPPPPILRPAEPAAEVESMASTMPGSPPETVRPAEPLIRQEPIRPIEQLTPPAPAPQAPPPELLPPPPPGRTAAPVEAEPVIERVIRAIVGQLVDIPFRGTGWVFLGVDQRGLNYDSRRQDIEAGVTVGQSFIFRAEEAGTYILRFFRQDFIQDISISEYVQVIITEGTEEISEPGEDELLAVDEEELSEVPRILLPGESIRLARDELDAGRAEAALSILDTMLQNHPIETDETLWLLGQLYEVNSPSRDIRQSLEYYRRLIWEFPQSIYVDPARRRIAFLERFFFNIR